MRRLFAAFVYALVGITVSAQSPAVEIPFDRYGRQDTRWRRRLPWLRLHHDNQPRELTRG